VPRHVARHHAARRQLLHLGQARCRLLRLRSASGRLGTSRGSSRGPSRCSSSTTPPRAGSSSTPRAGSSSTTSPTPHVRVPRHVTRLVTRPVTLLVVDYSASRRLVVDYFAYATRPGASARRAACHAAHRAAHRRLLRLTQSRHRLLRLRRASGCLGTSHGLSHGSSRRSSSTTPPRVSSSSTTSPPPRVRVSRHITRLVTRLVVPLVVDYSTSRWLVVNYSTSRRLVVDYFAYAARPGASARRAARHAASRAARRQLLRLAQARRRLLCLRRASGCLGTSRGSSLVVDYFAYATRLGASGRRAAHRSSSTTPRRAGSPRGSLRHSSLTTPPRAGSS
jgi:hypothetical protein